MKQFLKQFSLKMLPLGLVVVSLLSAHTALAGDPDANVTSVVSVEMVDDTAGATSNYAIGLSLADIDATSFSFLIQDARTGDPTAAGFNWHGVSFGPSTGVEGTGSVLEKDGLSYGYTVTVTSLTSTSPQFGFSNLVNSSTAGCYVLIVTTENPPTGESNFTESTSFTIGDASCDEIEETVPTGSISAVSVGDHVAVSWDAYTEDETLATYRVGYSLNEDLSESTFVNLATTETSYMFDLAKETTYYINIYGLDNDGGAVHIPYDIATVTTGAKTLAKTRYAKPTVKKIGKKKATVKWEASAAAEFVTKFKVEVLTKKGKQVAIYKNVSADVLKKVVTGLTSNKKYDARVKAVYDVNGTNTAGKWSRTKAFMTN